jgi:RNA polymerase sigma-70 factor, ECF subfamily
MRPSPELARFAALEVAELSREILAGNSAAFEEFYHRYAPRVYGLLMVLTNANVEVSRDLLQMVMLRAARKFRPASSGEALWSWLATVSRNVLIDHVRSEDRRRRREESALFESKPACPELSEDLSVALEEALVELPPEDQALIRDFYFREQPQAAIAESQHSTIKAVQCRLARIRRHLKEILTRKLEDEN